MLGIAFLGGSGPAPDAIKDIARYGDLLIAADSGLIAAEMAGLKPDWVLGDMDSLDDLQRLDKYPPERVLRYPSEKDYTDTELAITFLQDTGCDEIWLVGGGGGRLDHLLAIYSLFELENPPCRWFTANEEIRCLTEKETLSVTLAPGSRLSLLPIGASPWEAESTGLKWSLCGLPWKKGGQGLSNTVIDGLFEIRSKNGRFMVIWEQFQNKKDAGL